MAKSKVKIVGMQWEFYALWNEALRSMPERVMQKREHIWASELGGDYATRYLKMHAHPYSNPPNDRSYRKFSAGHIWEWIVGFVLTLTGILKEKQLRGEVHLKGLLRVSGKLDFIAGGEVDWEKARHEVETIKKLFSVSVGEMPPIIFHAIERVLWRMEQMFTRVPLKPVILEAKSVSSFISDLIEKTGKPRPGHTLQNLHYILANPDETDEGMLLYINRDDAYCQQFCIEPSKDLLKIYRDDVKGMTEAFQNSGKNYLKNIPAKEPEILYEGFKFQKNYHVQYSPYLTTLYGYKNFEEYKVRWDKNLSDWNRVFKRIVKGDNITPGNLEIIKSAAKQFPQWELYIKKAKIAKAFDKPEENEED